MGVMDLYDVMRSTAAVREFTGEPLSDEVLFRILDQARFAPSGGNRQGAHVVVVRDPDTRAELARLNEPGVRRYMAQVAAGEKPWNPVHPVGPTPDEIAATAVPGSFVEPLLTCSVALVVWVDLEVVAAMDQNLDRIGVVSGASVYPLVWNILLAARAEGFGGTITTMAVAQEEWVRRLLGAPSTYALAAVVPLGQPVKQLTRLRRQPVEEFATREHFDGAAFGCSGA